MSDAQHQVHDCVLWRCWLLGELAANGGGWRRMAIYDCKDGVHLIWFPVTACVKAGAVRAHVTLSTNKTHYCS